MGLSSKEVSADGELGWTQALLQAQRSELSKPPAKRQPPQQPAEQLNCPRCDSTNTKFCYYNNYNKTQPRHFCKACKRHWTKGGTLRNVPVGGGRKNKRHNTSISSDSSGVVVTKGTTSRNRGNPQFEEQGKFPILPPNVNNPVITSSFPAFSSGDALFPGSIPNSTIPIFLPQNQALHFPFSCSSSSSFDTNPSSISTTFQSPAVEDPTITMSAAQPPWQTAATAGLEMTNYWNWEDIDALVSTDLNIPWDDDSELKP